MNRFHRARLAKMANYMLNLNAEHNANHFRMSHFLKHNGDTEFPEDVIKNKLLSDCLCGTTACAVGHTPLIFPKLVKSIIKENGYADWCSIERKLFGTNGEQFDWLFSGHWGSSMNAPYTRTSWAVADRIMYLLEKPKNAYGNGRDFEYHDAYMYCAKNGMITEEAIKTKLAKYVELCSEPVGKAPFYV